MIRFTERTEREQTLIRRAYEWEVDAINREDAGRNPYYDGIIALREGRELWEAIDEALWLAYH